MREEVGLHRTVEWHRTRLAPTLITAADNLAWHPNERHTEHTVASELPDSCHADVAPETLQPEAIRLIL